MTPGSEDAPPRRWITTAIVCAALLLLPILGWLALPAPRLAPQPATTGVVPRVEAPATPIETPSPRPKPSPTASAAKEAEPDATDVTGVVLDPEGKPAAQAFVECDDKERGVSGGATDAEGKFRLPLTAAGCEASATHSTFGPSEPVRLEKGRENTLRLTRGGAINGIVVDEVGSPVKTYVIAVEFFSPKGEPPAQHMVGKSQNVDDPSGSFQLDGLVAGKYVLTASAADGRPPAQSDHIGVETGASVRGVRVVLARGAILVGRVTDADTHAPIAGVNVALDFATVSGANAISSVVTDAAGSYTLVGCPSGPFSVRFTHSEHKIKVVSGVQGKGGSTVRQDVELRKGNSGAGEIETDGIGAFLLTMPNGNVQVMAVLKDSPAERAGLKGSDMLQRIDGVSTDGMSTVEATQKIRGTPGTRVTLVVSRDGKNVEIVILRETIVR